MARDGMIAPQHIVACAWCVAHRETSVPLGSVFGREFSRGPLLEFDAANSPKVFTEFVAASICEELASNLDRIGLHRV